MIMYHMGVVGGEWLAQLGLRCLVLPSYSYEGRVMVSVHVGTSGV